MSKDFDAEEHIRNKTVNQGIKRCDEVLSNTPDEPLLLSKKLKLLYAANDFDGAEKLLADIGKKPVKATFTTTLGTMGPGQNIHLYEEVINDTQADLFPRPLTHGKAMAAIWDVTIKGQGSTDYRFDLASQRFGYAIVENRVEDAHQALIQLKALKPKDRMLYLAHVALTQMLSKKDGDIHQKLALAMAKKAVSEGFDADSKLDVRVPGQVFAAQNSVADLEKVKSKGRMADSKQVFEALADMANGTNGDGVGISDDSTLSLSQLDLKESGTTLEWLSAKVDALQSLYTTAIASSTDPSVVLPFATAATHLFNTGLAINTIKHPFADACFLAISALIQLHSHSHSNTYLYRAAFLAEVLLAHNADVHEAKYILILLYMRLGLGSLAMRYFEGLRIKEIQFDTVGHTLFSEIGITHPHDFSIGARGRRNFNPLKVSDKALEMYVRHETRIADTAVSVLEHGQTGMLFDLQALRDRLRDSYTRRLLLLERRRIARMLSVRIDEDMLHDFPRATADWLQSCDNRDFNAAFDYGFPVEEALHGVRDREEELLLRLVVDSAWSALHGAGMVVKEGELQDHFGDDYTNRPSTDKNSLPFLVADLAYHILCLALGNTEKSGLELCGVISDAFARIEEKAKEMTSETAGKKDADFLLLHGGLLRDHFRVLESCKLVSSSSARLVQQALKREDGPKVREAFGKVAARAEMVFAEVQKSAAAAGKRVAGLSTDVHAAVVGAEGDEVGTALAALGEKRVEKFVKDVLGSGKLGWEGVGLVKI